MSGSRSVNHCGIVWTPCLWLLDSLVDTLATVHRFQLYKLHAYHTLGIRQLLVVAWNLNVSKSGSRSSDAASFESSILDFHVLFVITYDLGVLATIFITDSSGSFQQQ